MKTILKNELLVPLSRHSGARLLVFAIVCMLCAITILSTILSFRSQLCTLGGGFIGIEDCSYQSLEGSVSFSKMHYYQNTNQSYDGGFGVVDSIHVVSLRRRNDRRQVMEKLREGLNTTWNYFDALEKNNDLVNTLLRFALMQREQFNTTIEWPPDGGNIHYDRVLTDVLRTMTPPSSLSVSAPVLCATEDNTIPWFPNMSAVPYHMVLSPGMLACWFSHAALMAEIVKSTRYIRKETWDGRKGSVIILEDDVDMEWDIQERLTRMWPDLPRSWDIVFLGALSSCHLSRIGSQVAEGYCWSDESRFPPIKPGSQIHPSHKPKCTHGYVLSPFGARRLLAHLNHPQFAFSRAIDQAISYLVAMGRLRAFSVVPAIVAQRRCGEVEDAEDCEYALLNDGSDIWLVDNGMTGSQWRDKLQDSALARIQSQEHIP